MKELFLNQEFLVNLFKNYFNLTERTVLAQVCAFWRDVLYNEPDLWTNAVFVINCHELRRVSNLSTSANDVQLEIMDMVKSGGKKQESKLNLDTISIDSIDSLDPASDVKSNLYISIEMRRMDKVAFLGANDADIMNFTSKMTGFTLKNICHLSLRSTSVTDKGLEALLGSVNNSLTSLELSGTRAHYLICIF